jgi:hypothetical protein
MPHPNPMVMSTYKKETDKRATLQPDILKSSLNFQIITLSNFKNSKLVNLD